jgi:hypothetical protein
VGSLVFARRGRPTDFTLTAKVSGTPTPTAERPAPAQTAGPATGFVASGSWVMSSLPACWREGEYVRGRWRDLRGALPPAAERVASGSTIVAGECTLRVRDDEVWITRGADRLRIPPHARLYRTGSELTLVYQNDARVEIRRYEPLRGSGQSFAPRPSKSPA